jgi:hypothetical protein
MKTMSLEVAVAGRAYVRRHDLRRTRWSFAALCAYLLSQAFTIPVLALGPSWAVWPTLSDAAVGLMLFAWLAVPRPLSRPSAANCTVLFSLVVLLLGGLISYLILVLALQSGPTTIHGPYGGPSGSASGITFGAFQVYHLAKFVVVFWLTARVPLSPRRLRALSVMSSFVFLFVCLGVILSYFAVVPTSVIGGHLPSDFSVAGPWGSYVRNMEEEGLGTIGYNHMYVAAQVLLLASLAMHLSARHALRDSALLLLAILACGLSGSRAGLAGALVFAVAMLVRKPLHVIVCALLVATAALTVPADWTAELDPTVERQATLAAPYEEKNLSGRVAIWQDRLAFLNQEPARWIVGSGFGSTVESGSYAHMLYLQIVLEMGVVGLAAFLFVAFQVLQYLRRRETGVQPILWATVALLFSSLTQETFYPSPAAGHFLGFYLWTVAIALRSKRGSRPALGVLR